MSLLPFNVASCPICGISVTLHKFGSTVLSLFGSVLQNHTIALTWNNHQHESAMLPRNWQFYGHLLNKMNAEHERAL